MRTIAILLALTGTLVAATSEAWWLEMEKSTHEWLSKQWQPLFFTECAGRIRVLMARNPGAESDFRKPAALFSLMIPAPELHTMTWVLAQDHPVLIPDTKHPHEELLQFYDTTRKESGKDKQVRSFGVITNIEFRSLQHYSVKYSMSQTEMRSRYNGRHFIANGQTANLDKPLTFPTIMSLERAFEEEEDVREAKDTNIGNATLQLMRLP